MENGIIAQSISQYRQIARLSIEIELALQGRNLDALSLLCETMAEFQEDVKANDSLILDILRRPLNPRESMLMQELLTLMQEIQERNQQLSPQISGIMAVQRNELQKLNCGNTLLQGYRPSPDQTGRRISSAG